MQPWQFFSMLSAVYIAPQLTSGIGVILGVLCAVLSIVWLVRDK